MLFFNAGSKDRSMNASLAEIFWGDAPRGTAPQVKQSWDIYDLWANRMSNTSAFAIINRTASNSTINGLGSVNITALGGAKEVFAPVPPSNSTALMGSKIGVVEAQGTLTAQVKAHGVAMLRLRAQPTTAMRRDEL